MIVEGMAVGEKLRDRVFSRYEWSFVESILNKFFWSDRPIEKLAKAFDLVGITTGKGRLRTA